MTIYGSLSLSLTGNAKLPELKRPESVNSRARV